MRDMYRMQEFTKYVVKVYEKNVDHKNLLARWEVVYFSERVNAPIVI